MTAAQQLNTQGVRFALGAPVLHIASIAGDFLFATGDGRFHRVRDDKAVAMDGHHGVSLACCTHPGGFALSGGDDGRVLKVSVTGVDEVAAFGRDWPNAMASTPASGLTAISAGSKVHVLDRALQPLAVFDHPSTVGGVAFDPKGKRLVASHYGGVSVRMAANPAATARLLKWKGSHRAVTWSPCGRFIVTSMQENAIHGWRVQDAQHFRMHGYPQRVRSFDWLDRGRKLATTGAGAEVLLWPFVGPRGPMGKTAEALSSAAETDARVLAAARMAARAAVGYHDGSIRLFVLSPQAGYTLAADTGAAVSALAFSEDAGTVAYGREDGTAGVILLA